MLYKIYFLSFYLLLACVSFSVLAKKELKFLHVLSANKFYVPDYNSTSATLTIPKNFTYEYFLENSVDVPNNIKVHLYNLGMHLRDNYNTFIGSLFFDKIQVTRTTPFPISIIAGELINAGLWPPFEPQIWKTDLLWQPIPFVYEPVEKDTLLLGTLCPNFIYETHNVLKNHYNLTTAQLELLNYINEEGQISISNPIDISLFYLAVENSVELNQIHPNWLKKIFPSDNLLNLTLTAYDLLSTTILQKRLNGGSLIKSIIKDFNEHINGTLSSSHKINIYSGDDRNLAGVLKNLNIPFYELPDAGAALIFELFLENNDYFIKINYYTGTTRTTIPHALNGCELFCPIEKFTELVADILPEDELSLCGLKIEPEDSHTGGASTNIVLMSHILLFVFSLILK